MRCSARTYFDYRCSTEFVCGVKVVCFMAISTPSPIFFWGMSDPTLGDFCFVAVKTFVIVSVWASRQKDLRQRDKSVTSEATVLLLRPTTSISHACNVCMWCRVWDAVCVCLCVACVFKKKKFSFCDETLPGPTQNCLITKSEIFITNFVDSSLFFGFIKDWGSTQKIKISCFFGGFSSRCFLSFFQVFIWVGED